MRTCGFGGRHFSGLQLCSRSPSTQPFTACSEPQLSDFSNAELAVVSEGTAKVLEWAKEIPELEVIYGTDLFFVPQGVFDTQAQQMEHMLTGFEPGEILKMAIGNAGVLLKMSGPDRDPCLDGALGVVQDGAYADLLLVAGNLLDDLGAVTDSGPLAQVTSGRFLWASFDRFIGVNETLSRHAAAHCVLFVFGCSTYRTGRKKNVVAGKLVRLLCLE